MLLFWQVYYNKKIEGELVAGAILNLNGIQAKQLFLWLPVTGIHVDPESPAYIYFEVGALSKKLSIALFDAPPTCHERTSSESTRVTDFFDSTVKVRFFKIHTLMCNVFAWDKVYVWSAVIFCY